MANKSKFLKNILTSVSAAAIVASAGSTYAVGVQRTTTGTPSTLNNGNNLDQIGAPPAVTPFASGNHLKINGAHQVSTNGFTGTISSIDAAAGASTFTTNQVLTIGSIGSTGGTTDLIFGAGVALTLNGTAGFNNAFAVNTYSGLRAVDFANRTNSVLEIAGPGGTAQNPVSLSTNFTSTGGNKGAIVVNNDYVELKGTFDATVNQKVATLTVNDGKTLIANTNVVLSGNLTLGSGAGGGKMIVKAGKNLTVADITGSAADKGELTFEGASTVTSKVGNTQKLNKVNIGAGEVNIVSGTYKATTTVLTDNAAGIKFSTPAGIAVETNITTTADGQGKVSLDNGNLTLNGKIGAEGKRVAEVNLVNKALTFTGADALELHAAAVKSTANNGSIVIKSNNFVIDAVIGSGNSKIGDVKIDSQNAGGAAIVQVKPGSEIHANGNVDLSSNAGQVVNNELHLFSNTVIDAGITATNVGQGKVLVKGNTSVSGQIQNIDQLILDTPNKAIKLAHANPIANLANGVNFTADATIELTDAQNNIDFNGPVVVGQNNKGVGTIKANTVAAGKNIAFRAIGDVTVADKKLKLLEATGGGIIDLQGAAAIEKINIGNADTTIKLSNAGQYYIGNLVGDNTKGTIDVGGNVTLKAGTKLGTSEAKRKEVLLGNNTLTLEDGVNIFAGEMKGIGAGQGNLTITGDSVIDTVIGNTAAIQGIAVTGTSTANGSKKTATFKQKVNVDGGNITISQGATAVFEGDVIAANIQGSGNKEGTARFANSKDKVIDAVIGAVRLANVEIHGANLTFKKNVQADTLAFTNDKEVLATIETAGSLNNAKITSKSGSDRQGILLKKIDYTFTNTVGSVDKPFGYVKVEEGDNKASKKITLTNPDFYASVLTSNNENNTVEFKAANGKVRNIGLQNTNFKTATFYQDTTVAGNAWSKDMVIKAGKTINFAKIVSGSGALTFENGSTVNVDDNGTWRINASGAAANTGVLNFAGNAGIFNAIGSSNPLSQVNFNGEDGKTIGLNQDITARSINFKKSTVILGDGERVLEGATTFDGTAIDLTKNLTLKGGASKLTGTPTINVYVNAQGQAEGKILVTGANASLDMSGADNLNINIEDLTELPGEKGSTVDLIRTDNGATFTALAAGKEVKPNDSRNGFVIWTFDNAKNVLTQKNVASDKLKSIVASKNNSSLTKDAALLGDAKNTGSAKAFVTDLSKISDTAKIAEAVERLTTPILTTTAITEGIFDAVSEGQIRSRIASVAAPMPGMQTTGVAAGDEQYIHGVWVMPFYSAFRQDTKDSAPGYDASSAGATVGADTQVNADLTLGLAATYTGTNVKHKGALIGDKTKGNTYMFTVYGVQQLTDNWFLQGNASLGSTKFKNTQKRITSSKNEQASGKFDATSYGGEILAGYNYHASGLTFSPLAGISFNRFNDSGYTEAGTTFQNLNVKKKSSNRFEAIAGARLDFGANDMGEMQLTPEIHGFVRHDFISKDNKVTINLDGVNGGSLSEKKHTANATHVNLGLGLTGKSDEYEYGVGYDANIASKFIGHQGSLKFRLNF